MTIKLYSNSPAHPALLRLPLAICLNFVSFLSFSFFLTNLFHLYSSHYPLPLDYFFFFFLDIPMCFNVFIGCTGSFLLCGLLSTCGQWGYSLACEWSPHCSGCDCCGVCALECEGFSNCGTRVQQLWFLGSGAQAQELWPTGLWKSSQFRDWTHVSSLAGGFFTTEPLGKSLPCLNFDFFLYLVTHLVMVTYTQISICIFYYFNTWTILRGVPHYTPSYVCGKTGHVIWLIEKNIIL